MHSNASKFSPQSCFLLVRDHDFFDLQLRLVQLWHRRNVERETASLIFYTNVHLLRADRKREARKLLLVLPLHNPIEAFCHLGITHYSDPKILGAILCSNHLISVQYVDRTISRHLFKSCACATGSFIGGGCCEIESYQWITPVTSLSAVQKSHSITTLLLSKIREVDPDLKTTLREFKEYVDLSYESPREFAARIGVAKETIWYWLSGRRQPKAPSLAKLRRFLDAVAKRPLQGDGIS
jgi:DNA-binding transcriptional regulator YiaG